MGGNGSKMALTTKNLLSSNIRAVVSISFGDDGLGSGPFIARLLPHFLDPGYSANFLHFH
jgi:hypothetical protein